MISETDQMDYQLSTKTQSLQSISVGTNESEALHAKLIKKESEFLYYHCLEPQIILLFNALIFLVSVNFYHQTPQCCLSFISLIKQEFNSVKIWS